MEKKIAETISVRINVAKYEHIELTKYAEKNISYQSEGEMKRKEDELTDELLDNLIRNMRRLPDRLGKKTNAVVEIEESICKRIPEWLENSPIPNIANGAIDIRNKTVAEQNAAQIEEAQIEEKEEAIARPDDDELF